MSYIRVICFLAGLMPVCIVVGVLSLSPLPSPLSNRTKNRPCLDEYFSMEYCKR